MSKSVKLLVPAEHLDLAYKAAKTFLQFYNTPSWDKKKIIFDKVLTVHETKARNIIVRLKNPV